jgi:predicted adenylyl cyclase CyaB
MARHCVILIPPMPANIEIKAVLLNPAAAIEIAQRLSGALPEIIPQQDFFFPCDGARLKLRILSPDAGELICYQRTDTAAARLSQYQIARTADPQALLDILTATLGTAGVVRKTRRLFLIGQTRVHIDEVDGLGTFLEFEVPLHPGQAQAQARAIAEGLLADFVIQPDQLIAGAYVDLLRAQAAGS